MKRMLFTERRDRRLRVMRLITAAALVIIVALVVIAPAVFIGVAR